MLRPKLFTNLKDYNQEQFFKDLLSGTFFGIVALQLAIIFIYQIKDFLGLNMGTVSSDFIEKIKEYTWNINSVNIYAFAIGGGTVIILMLWTKLRFKVPGSLVALILSTVLVQLLKLPVE